MSRRGKNIIIIICNIICIYMKTWRLILPSEKLRFQSPPLSLSHPLFFTHTHTLCAVFLSSLLNPQRIFRARSMPLWGSPAPPRMKNNNNNHLLNIHKRRKRANDDFPRIIIIGPSEIGERDRWLELLLVFFSRGAKPRVRKKKRFQVQTGGLGDRTRGTACKSRRRRGTKQNK